MSQETKNLKQLLPHGSITEIARKIGISQPSVSAAIRRGNPGHPAVQEAVRMAQASGALATAQALASISAS